MQRTPGYPPEYTPLLHCHQSSKQSMNVVRDTMTITTTLMCTLRLTHNNIFTLSVEEE